MKAVAVLILCIWFAEVASVLFYLLMVCARKSVQKLANFLKGKCNE